MTLVAYKKTEKDWRIAEIKVNNWFEQRGFNSKFMDSIKKNNRGFDLLIEGKYRVNVKYANHTKRSENEFLFKTNKKKHIVKTTDFYLFMFKDLDTASGIYKYRAYLVPYEDAPFSNTITFTRTCLEKWEKYKLVKGNLQNLGIEKQIRTENVA